MFGLVVVELKKKYIETTMAVIMITALCFICLGAGCVSEKAKTKNEATTKKENSNKVEETEAKYTVVLDAGHGGKDPGKIGVNGCIESEINLSIVKKLQAYLESNGVKVVLTREDENGLYDESDTNKKRSDMDKRCEIIDNTQPDMMVSIHQNSYPSEGVKGAQVFYYKDSEYGEEIAAIIQKYLIQEVDEDNGRLHKENSNYYILKNVECPAVIVECGFLSNYSEAELLVNSDYQEKVAAAIGEGIMEYLTNK